MIKEEDAPVYTYDYRYKRYGGGIVMGLFFVFIGIIFLLNNLGLVPSDVWNQLWKLWPLLIVLLGLRLLVGKSWISRLVITLIMLFIFTGVLAYILYYYGVFTSLGFPNF